MAGHKIPSRDEVPSSDKWDLSSIYKDNDEWEAELKKLPALVTKVAQYKGKLGSSAETLLEALKAMEACELQVETVYHYASLKHSADEEDAKANDMEGRAIMAYTQMGAELSYFEPELQEIDEKVLRDWISKEEFADYKVYIEKLLYVKKYILSEKEERILSLQGQTAQTADNAFSMLTNVDMNKCFGTVKMDGVDKPLTQSTLSSFLKCKDRSVREEAYKKFYAKFEENQNTIAALYAGSVNQDVFSMRSRGYNSSLEAALFGDKVDTSVYHNLIDCIHKNLPTLHSY